MITKEDIVENLGEILEIVNKEIDRSEKSTEKTKSLRTLRKIKKRVERLKKDVPKIKRKNTRTDYSNNTFCVPMKISKELSNFLNHPGPLSRDEVQCAISAYINIKIDEERDKILRWKHLNTIERDLRDETNLSIIIPDDKLSKLLGYDEYVKQVERGKIINKKGDVVTNSDLKYCIVTKLLQKHFEK